MAAPQLTHSRPDSVPVGSPFWATVVITDCVVETAELTTAAAVKM